MKKTFFILSICVSAAISSSTAETNNLKNLKILLSETHNVLSIIPENRVNRIARENRIRRLTREERVTRMPREARVARMPRKARIARIIHINKKSKVARTTHEKNIVLAKLHELKVK